MFTATCRRGAMEFLTVLQLGKLCAIKWHNPAACIEHPKFILLVFVGKLGYYFFLFKYKMSWVGGHKKKVILEF